LREIALRIAVDLRNNDLNPRAHLKTRYCRGTLIRGANPPGRNFNLKMASSIPNIDGIQGRFIGSHLSADDEGWAFIVNVSARKFVTYFGSNGFWFD
jgi:hypothetical protein